MFKTFPQNCLIFIGGPYRVGFVSHIVANNSSYTSNSITSATDILHEMTSQVDPTNNASSNERPVEKKIEPLALPSFEEIRGQDIWNNCAVRSVVSGVLGGGLGILMGLFLGALDNPLMQEQMTARQQFVYTAKQMGGRSLSSAKAFGIMGVIFSGVECVVEKARAKHDTTNTLVAGCVTGGALSAKGGPQAACLGCAGFAAFSVLIEKFLDRTD